MRVHMPEPPALEQQFGVGGLVVGDGPGDQIGGELATG